MNKFEIPSSAQQKNMIHENKNDQTLVWLLFTELHVKKNMSLAKK